MPGFGTSTLAILAPNTTHATGATKKTALKPYNVTIRVAILGKCPQSGQDYVLPVDSPDAEHPIASTTANAALFTKTIDGTKPQVVAFTCITVEAR